MCLTFWARRGVWENLFRVEFVVSIGRVVGAKSAWPGNAQYGKFWPDLPNLKGYADFSGPAGGRSLRARVPPFMVRGL